VSLSIGSVSVGLTATKLPISAPGPGSLVLYNAGATAVTIGGSGVTAGAVGAGSATIAPGATVPLPLVSGVSPNQLWGITVTAPVILNWFYGTEVTPLWLLFWLTTWTTRWAGGVL
jgi:hypothetical protein